jgi:hypothetical protein
MTVKEYIQDIMLIFCMMLVSVVLPIVLVVGSASYDAVASVAFAGPVFIFEEAR